MRIIKESYLKEAAVEYPRAARALADWMAAFKAAEFANPVGMKAVFPTVDPVVVKSGNTVYVFNIRHNEFRLIAAIHFNRQVVFTLRFFTHAEYVGKTGKKNCESQSQSQNTARPSRTLTFSDLPRDYVGLCGVFTPRRIRDKADYANTVEVADAMAVHADHFSQDQEDYFDVLCTLIEAYDAEHVKWEKVSGVRLLKYLLEEGGLSGADLSRILGVSRLLGPMILRGDREITASHARALGAHFRMNPGAFIE